MRKGETHTTIKMAIMIATPSTHSTGGPASAALGVPKSCTNPRTRETTAAIASRIYEGSVVE